MIQTKKALMIALMIPIFGLMLLTASKAYVSTTGEEVELPITGYDPRDLLSGHYLVYQIEYGVNDICPVKSATKMAGFICLDQQYFSFSHPKDCKLVVRGVCKNTRFEAGIEKFFIPEEKAKALEKAIQSKPSSVVLSISRNGNAQVKDLLVNGTSWKELKLEE